jgi:hypothetical protein
LGIFSGLFTPAEVESELSGNDIEKISFAFFKQLSSKTHHAWTKLAISSTKRGSWDCIPVVAKSDLPMTTDIFAGVYNLGLSNPNGGVANTIATTGLRGTPRKYAKILLRQGDGKFRLYFKGCTRGKTVKTGMLSNEKITWQDQPRAVAKDDTGRTLVQCATLLGAILDPGCNMIEYRQRLLGKLEPE